MSTLLWSYISYTVASVYVSGPWPGGSNTNFEFCFNFWCIPCKLNLYVITKACCSWYKHSYNFEWCYFNTFI